MSLWGDENYAQNEISALMHLWLENPGNLTRLEIIGRLADCLCEAAEHAASTDERER